MTLNTVLVFTWVHTVGLLSRLSDPVWLMVVSALACGGLPWLAAALARAAAAADEASDWSLGLIVLAGLGIFALYMLPIVGAFALVAVALH